MDDKKIPIGSSGSSLDPAQTRMGGYRWVICALLFFATTINYVDRQVLSLLAKEIGDQVKWSEIEYARINIAFQAAYAIGLLCFGRLIDLFGTKACYAIAMIIWSIAAISHAAVKLLVGFGDVRILVEFGDWAFEATTIAAVLGFGAVRVLLGLGESGNFPAAIKATAEWFPKKERALATGIFNSGANIGAVLAPAVVPALTAWYGWPAAFVATGLIGFLWLFAWLPLYSRPEAKRNLDPRELAYIQSDGVEVQETKVKWVKLLRYRQTWAFIIGKFLTDPVWWFYLLWLPKWLNKDYALDLKSIGWPLVIVYSLVTIGSIGGGMISSTLMKRGMGLNASRKTAMFICATLVTPIVLVTVVSNVWIAVVLVGLAAAAHQGWSANLFTTVSDMFPKRAVGSVIGIGGMAGSLGAMLYSEVIGQVLASTGQYWVLFLIGATAYLVAFGIIQLLVPKMTPANIED
jgi:MFS transporter, ACS family, hexuronate transporter